MDTGHSRPGETDREQACSHSSHYNYQQAHQHINFTCATTLSCILCTMPPFCLSGNNGIFFAAPGPSLKKAKRAVWNSITSALWELMHQKLLTSLIIIMITVMKYLLSMNLWYIPELGVLYKKKRKKLGQYNSNNEFIHG